MWRGHVIKGKASYLGPWKRVVAFANQIAGKIVKRFPSEDFLKALDVMDPRQWADAQDRGFSASMFFVLTLQDADNIEWKLEPSFLRKFKVLEQQFRDLIPIDTVKDQFEDFLAERYGRVKLLNEGQFADYMINGQSGGFYDELIQ